MGFDFVNWDDNEYLAGAGGLVADGLSATGVWRAFTEPVYLNWAPLTILSYQCDATLAGDRPWIYHLTNVLLHAASAALLCRVLTRMTGRLLPSVAVATLFAVHPLRVESVAWVAERKDVLSVFFLMLALVAYERYCRLPSRARSVAVAAAMIASLLAKATLVTLPVLLLLLDWWPLQRLLIPGMGGRRRGDAPASPYPVSTPRQVFAEKLPLFALSAVFTVITIATQSRAIRSESALPLLSARVPNALQSVAIYLGETCVPRALHPVQVHPGPHGWSWPLVTLGSAAIVLLVCWAVLCRRGIPAVSVGAAWFLVGLSPVLGIVKQQGFQAHADRFTYVPHVGLLMAVVWSFDHVADRFAVPRWLRATGLGLLAAACVWQTERQLAHWRDSETLWAHVLAIDPANAHARAQLGAHRFRSGRDADAERLLFDALWIDPTLGWPRMYLAQIYFDAGDYRRARHYRDAAIRTGAVDGEAAAMAAGMTDLDARAAAQPPQRRSCGEPARGALAAGLQDARAGRFVEALVAFERAVAADPACAAAHNNVGLVHARRGDGVAAEAAFRRAIACDDQAADYQLNLAQTLLGLGRVAEARSACAAALRLAPWDAGAAEVRSEIERAAASH